VDRLQPASALPGRAVPRTLDWTGPPPDIAVGLHGNGPARPATGCSWVCAH
jgi:hypothetical protein